VAVLATGLSLVLRLSFGSWLGQYAPHMTFFPAVILSAYLGGLGPGLLATVLGAASGAYVLLGPQSAPSTGESGEVYALGLFVLAGGVISALTDSLHRSGARIAASERRYAVTLASIGDAVIATDNQARVSFLNPVAEALTGWPAADALGRQLEEVFRLINERTREPVEDPAAGVLRTGTVVGGATHTALVARDGRETPIDDCGAPIIDDRGAVAGVVLVFRNVMERRRAEEVEAVRRANERLMLALRGSNVGVWELEMPDGDPTRAQRHYVNMWELLGYEGPGPDRESVLDLAHPDDRAKVGELRRLAPAGEGAEYELEFRARHRDGSERIILARGSAMRDAAGQPLRFVGTNIDITRLKRAEEALAQERFLLRTLMDNIPDGIYFKDTAGCFLRINRALAEACGLTDPAQAVGKTDFDFFTEAVARPAYEDEQEIVRTGRPIIGKEEKTFEKERHVGWVSTTKMPLRARDGTIIGTFGVSRHIDTLKRAQEALRESEQRWRGLTEALPQLVWSALPDGTCDYFSTQWTEHTGVAETELLGWNWLETLHPEDRAPTRAFWLGSVADRHRYDIEYRVRRRDGEYRWFKTRGVPIRDGEGRIIKWFGTCTDITELRHTEEALRASERRFRVFVDHAADAFFLTDPEGRIRDVNHRACESLGYTRDELIGLTPFAFDPDLVPARVAGTVHQLLAGETVAFESRHRRKDGTIFPVEVRGKAFREGESAFFVSLVRDVTERKRAEAALRESEERFRGTYENAAVGIANVDTTGRFLRVNEKYCTIAGYPREELLQKTVRDITHPDDLEASLPPLRAVLRGVAPDFALENRYLRKDGSVVWVELFVSLQRDAAGKPAYAISVVQDISERKRLDAELRDAKEAEAERARLAELGRDVGLALSQGETLYELLQPSAAAMVRYLDAALARVWWLPPGGEVLELQASAGLYTHRDGAHARIPVGELKIGRIARDRRPVLTNEVQTDPCISDPDWVRREGLVGFAGYPLVVGDRTVGVLAMFSRTPLSGAVLQALESVAGVIALGIERKQQDAALRRATEAAVAANRAKDEFLANVSHEIRTPMGAILGMTELTLDTELTDDQRQYLMTVKVAADNLLGIINDLLDFAKIEAGKLELDPADFSLRSVVAGTLRALAARAHRKGIELIHQVRPDVPDALIGDAARLRQVLLNLVGNAIKFTDAGEVEVTVGIADRGLRIDDLPTASGLSSNPQSEICNLQFSVRDTGIGIPKDKQERIFRAFEQEDTSTTRKYGGTGLGLTIATRLVALMGGTITVDSESGRGSTFAFTARFGRQPPAPEEAQARPPALLQDLPVLIVDDNATYRHILEELLRGWGMRPAPVGDATAALDVLRRAVAGGRPYRLALLDARMPDTDGLELAGRIRRDPELSGTRIILLTSGDRPGERARARELRIEAHLLKPVQQDELLGTIHQAMSRAEGADLPADSPTAARAAVPALVPSGAELRVLVAEDNEFNVQLLEQLLGRRGHQVRVATNGREALEILRIADRGLPTEMEEDKAHDVATVPTSQSALPFDLLLLDIHMPELDGFQVVRAVRAHERVTGGHLPVIALTARSRKEDRERCLAAGMDDYLAKPIQAAELWTAIERVLVSGVVSGEPSGTPPRATHHAPPTAPLLNPRAVLAACGGNSAILERIAQAFRAGLPGQVEAVRSALRDGDAARLQAAAHRLSGMVAAFSTVAGGVVSELEDRAAQGDLESARPLMERLEAMAEELMRLTDGLSIESLR
jgi:PAS domain S-box-containing protein